MYTSRLHEAFCSLARDRYDDLYDWEMLSEAVTKAFGPMRPKRLEEAIRQLHFVIFVTIGEEGFESDDRLPGHPLSRVVKQEVVSDGAGEQNRQGRIYCAGGEDGIVEVKPSSTYTMRNLNQRRMYTSRLHEAFCSLARDRYDDLYDWEMLSEAVTKAFGPMRPKRLEEAIRQLHFVIFVTIGEEGFESDDRLPGHPLSRVVKQE
ncbi:unnamed protein product, partial [Nippostrongylus brasiliensis]|uniref:RE_EcoO109I domain-containing protein n=1 Tax=Nippostrongylus brasiliensis TaxID=27835 RepID=A0A0N4YWS9_NIPBR